MREFLPDPFHWFVIVITILFSALMIYLAYLLFTPQAQRDFERRNAFMQICTQSENYSRDECIRLAGKIE